MGTTKPWIPRTLARLRVWLAGSEDGQRLVRECSAKFFEEKCRACEKGIPVPRVLVVVRRLGRYPGVEVYREKGVNVWLEELVDSQDDPAIERLVDDLLVAQLPRNWKHLVDCRSDSIVFTGLTAERQMESLITLELLRELKAWKLLRESKA